MSSNLIQPEILISSTDSNNNIKIVKNNIQNMFETM